MTNTDPRPLGYMPQGYCHRQSKWIGLLAFAVAAAVVLAVLDWRGSGPPWWGQGIIIGAPGLMALLAYVFHWVAECRVEGDSLWFTAENIPPVSVAIADIVAIDKIESENSHFEIVVRGKGRMMVAADVFEPIKALREALHARNPSIRFGSGPAGVCRECGAPLFGPGVPSIPDAVRLVVRQTRCPACNATLPRFGRFV